MACNRQSLLSSACAAKFNCLQDKALNRATRLQLLCNWLNGAPSGLLIRSTSTNGNIIMDWAAVTTPPTTYEIWRSTDGGVNYALRASVGGGTTTYTDAGVLAAADQWYFKVRACTGSCSNFSDPAGIFRDFQHLANTGLLTYNFPFLQFHLGNFDVSNQAVMTSVLVPRLHTCTGYFAVYNSNLMATVDISSLVKCAFFQISGPNATMTSMSGPVMTTCVSNFFNVSANSALTSISFPVLVTIPTILYFNDTPSLASISLPALSTIGASVIGNNSGIVSFSIPNVATVADLNLSNCVNLTTLTLNLVQIGGLLNLNGCTSLASLAIPSLNAIMGGVDGSNCTSLTTIFLTTITLLSGGLLFDGCTNLSSMTFGAPTADDGVLYSFTNCALDATSVNALLALGVANGWTSATVDTSGGTSAAPTGQGILDKATLIGNGCTVTTN